MLALSDTELNAVVDNSADFEALKIAKSNFMKDSHGNNCVNGISDPDIQSIEDFLSECGLEVYIQLFKGKLFLRRLSFYIMFYCSTSLF